MDNTPIAFPGLGIEVNPSRIAFNILGKDIYWYGIIIALGFLLAMLYAYKRSKHFGFSGDDLIDILLVSIPSAVVGARLYYVVFNFSLYKDNPAEIVRIWDGGLAIYGGIIFGILAAWIVSRIKKIKISAVLDVGALGLLIGQAIGRWGNFFNREAYGAATDAFWRMGVYTWAGEYITVHPTFLYESLWNVAGFIILHFYSKRHRRYDGQIFLLYLAWYGFGRGLIEGLRTDSLYLFDTGIRISQLLGFLSCAVAVVLLVVNRWFIAHDPRDMAVYKMQNKNNAAGGDSAQADTAQPLNLQNGHGEEKDNNVGDTD